MTTQPMTHGPLAILAALFTPRGGRTGPQPDVAAEARAARDGIDHMLARCPEAFTSELDIQCALHGLR